MTSTMVEPSGQQCHGKSQEGKKSNGCLHKTGSLESKVTNQHLRKSVLIIT